MLGNYYSANFFPILIDYNIIQLTADVRIMQEVASAGCTMCYRKSGVIDLQWVKPSRTRYKCTRFYGEMKYIFSGCRSSRCARWRWATPLSNLCKRRAPHFLLDGTENYVCTWLGEIDRSAYSYFHINNYMNLSTLRMLLLPAFLCVMCASDMHIFVWRARRSRISAAECGVDSFSKLMKHMLQLTWWSSWHSRSGAKYFGD